MIAYSIKPELTGFNERGNWCEINVAIDTALYVYGCVPILGALCLSFQMRRVRKQMNEFRMQVRTIPYRTVPYRTVPYRTVPYRTVCVLFTLSPCPPSFVFVSVFFLCVSGWADVDGRTCATAAAAAAWRAQVLQLLFLLAVGTVIFPLIEGWLESRDDIRRTYIMYDNVVVSVP